MAITRIPSHHLVDLLDRGPLAVGVSHIGDCLRSHRSGRLEVLALRGQARLQSPDAGRS